MIYTQKHFYKVCRPVVVAGAEHTVMVNKPVRVVFFEKIEMWSAPDLLGPEKMSWFDLRKKVLRKLAAEERASVVRQFTPPRVVDISPKSASEVFG